MRRVVVLLGVLACVAPMSACSSSAKAAGKKDVSITACAASPSGGHPTVAGKIVNHSSKASLYTIHVKFTDASGNGVGDGVAAVARVEPSATATWHATGTLDAKGPVKCSLSSATRNLAP